MTEKSPVDRVRAVLKGIAAAKALEMSEREGKVIVEIPENLFLSNEDFGKIHLKLADIGGRYLFGAKAWEIEISSLG